LKDRNVVLFKMNAFSYPFSQGRSLGAQRGLETNVLKDTNAQQQKRNTGI